MDLNLHNLKMEFKHIENSQTFWNPDGINGCDEETFVKNNPNADKSVFAALDMNDDGYISEREYTCSVGMAGEDGILTNSERNEACMEEMLFFARRGIDKNRDGFGSNLEWASWDSNDWEVTIEQWQEIGQKLNGTYGDETRLNGKTRADIPENRQDLLRFLEEKGWLYEQFK